MMPSPLGGSNPLVGWLNKLREEVIASRITSVLGGKISTGACGTQLIIDGNRGGTSVVATQAKTFRYKSMSGDYLVCRAWDGTTEGSTDIYVAKSPKLRHSITSETFPDSTVVSYSAYDTATQTRTADDGTTSYTQVVVPLFLANDLIYADKPEHTFVNDGSTPAVECVYMDQNRDGRAWAKQYVAP